MQGRQRQPHDVSHHPQELARRDLCQGAAHDERLHRGQGVRHWLGELHSRQPRLLYSLCCSEGQDTDHRHRSLPPDRDAWRQGECRVAFHQGADAPRQPSRSLGQRPRHHSGRPYAGPLQRDSPCRCPRPRPLWPRLLRWQHQPHSGLHHRFAVCPEVHDACLARTSQDHLRARAQGRRIQGARHHRGAEVYAVAGCL